MSITIFLIIIIGAILAVIIAFIIKSVLAPKKLTSLNNMLKQVSRWAKQLLAKDDRNVELHYILALSYIAQNKAEVALMELKKINNLGNFGGMCTEINFRKTIAGLFEKFGNNEEALTEYLLLTKLEPYEGDHFFKTGLLFELRNKGGQAHKFYKKAIELNPHDSNAHFRLGYILYRSKRYNDAKVELEISIKYDSANYQASYYLGKIFQEMKDFQSALKSFERAQKDPTLRVKSIVSSGHCYLAMKNFNQAASEFERAINMNPEDETSEILYARYFLSLCYEKKREVDGAIEQWEKIYKVKPDFKDVAEKLTQYQDLRTDDYLKDYLTASSSEFNDICLNVAKIMNLSVQDVSPINGGLKIIAVEQAKKQDWRNLKKMPQLVYFSRIPENIDVEKIRIFHEDMKQLGINRGRYVSSSSFSRTAVEFSESRPIILVNKEMLQKSLKMAFKTS
jgi:tetratricopeptide (TPR) repeat protein